MREKRGNRTKRFDGFFIVRQALEITLPVTAHALHLPCVPTNASRRRPVRSRGGRGPSYPPGPNRRFGDEQTIDTVTPLTLLAPSKDNTESRTRQPCRTARLRSHHAHASISFQLASWIAILQMPGKASRRQRPHGPGQVEGLEYDPIESYIKRDDDQEEKDKKEARKRNPKQAYRTG